MEKLNHVLERARLMHKNLQPIMVDIGEIEAIAEAFRVLEQRAEAAESKLAELEKQEGRLVFTCTGCEHSVFDEHPSSCDCGQGDGYTMSKLFTRPAPAIKLAELVPPKVSVNDAPELFGGLAAKSAWSLGVNTTIEAMLRNIDEKSK